jgi:hypothetical protein
MVVLGLTLPDQVAVRHWSIAWLGLDAMEACGLAATGIFRSRHDGRVSAVAGATAALLVMDAWFDMITAQPGASVLMALLMAGVVELPLAALCARIAWTAARRHPRAATAAQWRWRRRRGHRPGRPARSWSPHPEVTRPPRAA